MSKETVLVMGSTGSQGGSVARHLLTSGRYHVKCFTRNPQSKKAKELQKRGASVVKGDLNSPKSLEKAMADCQYVFGVTNFWESGEKEYDHGVNIVDAAVKTGVEHLVLSTLPSVEKITAGKYHVPHFDLKAKVEDYARGTTVNCTFVHVAFYFENFLNFFPPRDRGDGCYLISFPQGNTPLAGVGAEDIGSIVFSIIFESSPYINKVIGIVGDELTGEQYADELTKAVNQKVIYQTMAVEDYARLGFPGAQELAQMFGFNRDFVESRTRDLEFCRELSPNLTTFRHWAELHRAELLDVMNIKKAA